MLSLKLRKLAREETVNRLKDFLFEVITKYEYIMRRYIRYSLNTNPTSPVPGAIK